jgi:hypothetical protein
MRVDAMKRDGREALMQGMLDAIRNMDGSFPDALKTRQLAIDDFRRIEKLFGYKPGHWVVFTDRAAKATGAA